jgi:hypothetical protein
MTDISLAQWRLISPRPEPDVDHPLALKVETVAS